MFVSYRSSEEARQQAITDSEFILGLRSKEELSSIIVNSSTSKLTSIYKEYLDQLVLLVKADFWKLVQLNDQNYKVVLIWNDGKPDKKAA